MRARHEPGRQNLKVHFSHPPLRQWLPKTPGLRSCPGTGHPLPAEQTLGQNLLQGLDSGVQRRAGSGRPFPLAASDIQAPVHTAVCAPPLELLGPLLTSTCHPDQVTLVAPVRPRPDRPPARLQKLGLQSGLKAGPALSLIRKPGTVSNVTQKDTSVKTRKLRKPTSLLNFLF